MRILSLSVYLSFHFCVQTSFIVLYPSCPAQEYNVAYIIYIIYILTSHGTIMCV